MTDAVDLETDTRNMTFVFLSGRRYNRRERLGKGKEEVESSPGGTFIIHWKSEEEYNARINIFTTQRRHRDQIKSTTIQRVCLLA